jgi:hypothetical protein
MSVLLPIFQSTQKIMLFGNTPETHKKILFETPDPLYQSLSQLKDTGLFLSPATEKIDETIEKAMKLS